MGPGHGPERGARMSARSLHPDISEAQLFLDALGHGEEFTFQTFPEIKAASGGELRKRLTRILHGKLDQHADELVRLNTGEESVGIFVTVNRTDGNGRKAENILGIRAVFVDLDGSPIEPVQNGPLAPSVVVESSPGRFHAYWLVRDVALSEFSECQKKLITCFNGDRAIHDLPRVLRVAGFYHRKGEPFRARLVICEANRVYIRDQLISAFGEPVGGHKNSQHQPPELSSNLENVKAKRLAVVQAEKVILRPATGRHRSALQLGYDCRREGLSEDAARVAAQEYFLSVPLTDSDGEQRPLTGKEIESAVVNAYSEGKTVNHERRLSDFIIVGPELRNLKIEARKPIIDPFLTERSLSMIYAKRGVGKTWLALQLGLSISNGTKFLEWPVEEPRSVLYVDGEMPLSDLTDRIMQLSGQSPPEKLMLLPSERLFLEDRPLVINDKKDQQRILEALDDLEQRGKRPDVVIFDNISSLTSGMDENSNSDLDTLLAWFIKLRHRGYAVVIVHHAGKSGQQRGASRREDLLDTSILLEELPRDARLASSGACFSLSFEKSRGKRPAPDKATTELVASDNGGLTWTLGKPASLSADTKVLIELYRSEPMHQNVLAAALDLSEARISKLVQRLRNNGHVARKGLTLTAQGYALAESLGAERMPL